MTTSQESETKSNGQGKFVPVPFTATLADGTIIDWSGRGRMPKPMLAAIESGALVYVAPSILRKQEQKIAKEAARTAKKLERELAKAAKAKTVAKVEAASTATV